MKDNTIQIRVISYNVEFGKNATSREFGLMLKSYHADIAGFNEAPAGDWIREVGKYAGMDHYYVGEISSANHKDKYKSILSRTPLSNMTEHAISGSGCWNPCSVVHATTIIGGVEFSVYSTHVCANTEVDTYGKLVHRGHIHDIVENVLPKDLCKRIILMGDFNVVLDSPALSLLEKQMRICWRDIDVDTKNGITWPTKLREGEKPREWIDHIMINRTSKGYAVDGGIIELDKPLSDHKPVWADIHFPKDF